MTFAYFGYINHNNKTIRILIVEKHIGITISEPFRINGEIVEIKDSDIYWVEEMLEQFGIDLVLS